MKSLIFCLSVLLNYSFSLPNGAKIERTVEDENQGGRTARSENACDKDRERVLLVSDEWVSHDQSFRQMLLLDPRNLQKTFSIDLLVSDGILQNTLAPLDDNIYDIDTEKGEIRRSSVFWLDSGITSKENWYLVATFPGGKKMRHVAATKGSEIYFIASDNVLYKFDSSSNNLGKVMSISDTDLDKVQLLVIKNLLYIFTSTRLLLIDLNLLGNQLSRSAPREADYMRSENSKVINGTIFLYKDLFCFVEGGDSDIVKCYDGTTGSFNELGTFNELRNFPAIAVTQSGILFIGGERPSSKSDLNNKEYLSSIEVYNFDTDVKPFRYVAAPRDMRRCIYLGVTYCEKILK